jgi:hypothetical protein
MAHNDSKYEGLPATWPFRAAGTILIVAFAWFCFGFAVKDMEAELSNHMPVFWGLLAVSVVLIVGGAAFNLAQARGRGRQEG